jgi:hypothetical protein
MVQVVQIRHDLLILLDEILLIHFMTSPGSVPEIKNALCHFLLWIIFVVYQFAL